MTIPHWRFAAMAKQASEFSGPDLKQGVFDILNSVKQTKQIFTLWTVLIQISASENKFYLKNTKSSNVVLSLDFKKLDYSCTTPVQVALIDSESMDSSVQLASRQTRSNCG